MSTDNSTTETFEGKEFFIGIDTSKKSWAVAVRCGGFQLSYKTMVPDPKKLYTYMERTYPGGVYNTVYEAGFCGFWIHRQLTEAGCNSIVVHPADVPTTDKERDRKTDAVDARKLAKELERGNLTGIYVPDKEAEQLRSLARLTRKTCTKEKSRWKIRITAFLDYYGIKAPEHNSKWSKSYIGWLENLELDNGPAQETLLWELEELKQLKKRSLGLERSLKRHCIEYFGKELVENIHSIPGIGWKTLFVLLTEIIDINRFPVFDELKSWAGLVPSCHDSGDTHKDKGITSRRNRYIRYCLIEASWAAITHDPELFAAYLKYTKRMKGQDAIIRISKKLLKRVYCIWNENRPYEIRRA